MTVLIKMVFLIAVINAAIGSLYMLIWKRYAESQEKKAEYVSIYRSLRAGILFFLLPGLIMVLPAKTLWFFALSKFSDWGLAGEILIPVWSVLTFIWLLGAACSTYKWLKEVCRFCKICRYNMEITDTGLQEYFQQISERQHVFSNLIIYKNSMIQIPVIFGIRGRTILLPESCGQSEELQVILEHEMIHARNKDLFIERVALFLHLFCWFTPYSGQMVYALEEWSETICDMTVCGSKDAIWSKRQYFDFIVRWAAEERSPAIGTAMALSGNYEGIKTRILRMRKYDVLGKCLGEDAVSAGSRLLILCCCVLLAVSFGGQYLGKRAMVWCQTRNLQNYLNWNTRTGSIGRYQQKSKVVCAGEVLTDRVKLKEGEQIQFACEIKTKGSFQTYGRNVYAYLGIRDASGDKASMFPYTGDISKHSYTAKKTGWYELVFENVSKKGTEEDIIVNYIILKK